MRQDGMLHHVAATTEVCVLLCARVSSDVRVLMPCQTQIQNVVTEMTLRMQFFGNVSHTHFRTSPITYGAGGVLSFLAYSRVHTASAVSQNVVEPLNAAFNEGEKKRTQIVADEKKASLMASRTRTEVSQTLPAPDSDSYGRTRSWFQSGLTANLQCRLVIMLGYLSDDCIMLMVLHTAREGKERLSQAVERVRTGQGGTRLGR